MMVERLDAEIVSALDVTGRLAPFNLAGVLAAADIHVARALARLGGDADELVSLAVAMAVRAPRVGHVLADLATVQATATADAPGGDEGVDLAALPWPELDAWLEHVASSPLVTVGGDGPSDRPLRLDGNCLYLARYWDDEASVAEDLAARSCATTLPFDEVLLAGDLAKLFPESPAGLQAQAAATSVRRLLSVIVGGPGTGKTTTVARLLAMLDEQARATGGAPPLVALAAPTGKAAARMAEAVHDEARRLAVDHTLRDRLLGLEAFTVHRLLGRHPAGANRFRHDRHNRLPHDVVVVDETSMMSLPLMARLLEAVRPEARLVLIGDQEQLASVEAGAVLADIVGPAGAERTEAARARAGYARTGTETTAGAIGECITVLRANHRFSGPLAELAEAVRAGDGDAVANILAATADPTATDRHPVRWVDTDLATAGEEVLEPVRLAVVGAGRVLVEAAAGGDAPAALDALGHMRVLCAHRDGPAGASTWNARAEQWLAAGLAPEPVAAASPVAAAWYAGRPVIVTQNDYSIGLFNGDTGVTIRRPDGGLTVVFRRGAELVTFSPSRLGTVETAFAMTAHRAQGSEFDAVVVLLPPGPSRIVTRELLYTALTRARRSAVVVGTEGSVRAAVGRQVARASGLTARLWGE